MENYLTIEEIKKDFPETWVLLGNPTFQKGAILGGIVVFHAETKSGLLEGRGLLKPYKRSTWTFTGERKRGARQWVSIFRQVPKPIIENEN